MYAIWKEGTVLVHWPLEHYLWWRKCLFWLYVRRFHVPRRFECDSAFQTIRNGHLFLKNKKILRMEKRRSNRMAINGSDEHSKNLAQKKKHDHLNARIDRPYMSMPQSNHFFFLLIPSLSVLHFFFFFFFGGELVRSSRSKSRWSLYKFSF